MSDYECILVEHEDGVGVITLNRPDVLNAMNTQLTGELHSAIGAMCDDDAVGCIVVTGSGERAFTAGGDIHEQRITTLISVSRSWIPPERPIWTGVGTYPPLPNLLSV